MKLVGNELFVGERQAVGSIFQVGEVHYYTRPDAETDWTRQSGFLSPTQTNSGQFGQAIDYDGDRVAVGEPGGNTVDVFTFSSGSETHEQQITPNFVEAGQRFGRAVAIDGFHMLIGAPNRDDTFTSEGAVEYWRRSGGTWSYEGTIQQNGGVGANEQFGQGVAMTDSATAYITWNAPTGIGVQKFTRTGTTWSFDSEFILTDYDNPGTNYATLDTDGTSLIIAQFNWDDSGVGTNEGVVLVTDLTGTITTTILGDPGDLLGNSATIDGTEAVIGQESFDDTATNQGRALVWDVCV
jgi:hypothetical protein